MDAQLRGVDVHLQMGIGVVEQTAYVLADLHAVHGEMLVRPFRLHLEGPGGPERSVQIVLGAVENGVLVLGTGAGPAGGEGALQVAVLILGLHVNRTLLGVNVEAAVVLEPAADVGIELVLEAPAVEALEDHLAQLQQNDLVHKIIFLSWGFSARL